MAGPGLAGVPIPGETGSHEAIPSGARDPLMVGACPSVEKPLLQ